MKKSSALAMAIAGVVAAPVASAEVYVSARLGFEHVSTDDTVINSEGLEFGNLSSRLGWRGETDLGNGLTAFGSLEAAAQGFSLRQMHVGLSGDFGSVKVGENTYAAFYNHVTGPVDQPYWILFPGLIETGRTPNVINYEGSAGAVRFGIGIGADGSDTSTTSSQAAVSIDIGDAMTLAIGVDDDDSQEESTTGITLHGTAGDISYAVTLQSEDDYDLTAYSDTFVDGAGDPLLDDVQGIQIWVSFGQFWVGYGQVDLDDNDVTPTVISAGYSAPIGRQTQFWVEVDSQDWDDVVDDATTVVAAIRYDYN